jgi:hypothetical protein
MATLGVVKQDPSAEDRKAGKLKAKSSSRKASIRPAEVICVDD